MTSDWRKAKQWMEQQVSRLQKHGATPVQGPGAGSLPASQNTLPPGRGIGPPRQPQVPDHDLQALECCAKSLPAFTNGERYQFQAKVRPDLMPLKKFIENIADFGADGSLFGDAGEIPTQFAELLREKTTTGNAAVNSPLDDYREFFEFDIEIETDDPVTGVTKTIGHLSKRIGPGSVASTARRLYVITARRCPPPTAWMRTTRMVCGSSLLDEAFDKDGYAQHREPMRYLEKLGLQVLLASPGENLPTLTAFLHRYFEIMKDETRHVIHVEERRVSEAMQGAVPERICGSTTLSFWN